MPTIMESTFSKVPLERILGTNLFELTAAEQHPEWLKEARVGEHVPESVEYGISAFTYRSRRPFHPQRLHDLAAVMEARTDLVEEGTAAADTAAAGAAAAGSDAAAAGFDAGSEGQSTTQVSTAGNASSASAARSSNAVPSIYQAVFSVVRAKGPVWLAGEYGHSLQGAASLAGRRFTVQPGPPWWAAVEKDEWPEGLADELVAPVWQEPWGDRQNELVVIGKDMDHDAVRAALDACLLTEKEMAAGVEAWEAELANPWKAEWALLLEEGGHDHTHDEDGGGGGGGDEEPHDEEAEEKEGVAGEACPLQPQPDVLAAVKQVLANKKKAVLAARAAATATSAESGPANNIVKHFGVFCDVTGRSPIEGVRYHKRGEDYDICAEAFEGLPAAEQALFLALTVPTKINDYKQTKKNSKNGTKAALTVHPGVTCGASGQHPVVGPRYHKIGEDFDLCESEFNKLPAQEQRRFLRLDHVTSIVDWNSTSASGGQKTRLVAKRKPEAAKTQAGVSKRPANSE